MKNEFNDAINLHKKLVDEFEKTSRDKIIEIVNMIYKILKKVAAYIYVEMVALQQMHKECLINGNDEKSSYIW